MKESLDLALRVHPDTRHVFVVCGASPRDADTKTSFARRCPRRRQAWSSPSCADSSVPALTDRLAALPEHSIVFLVIAQFRW